LTITSLDIINYQKDVPFLPALAKNGDRADWYRFYDQMLDHRLQVAIDASRSQSARQREIERCTNREWGGKYWLATYGTIYEAREPDAEEEVELGYEDEDENLWVADTLPFIPYNFQFGVWDWLDERMRSRGRLGDGLLVKSRDMGISNLGAGFIAHRFQTRKPFQGRLMSRIEKLVDVPGDPDSLLWKLETNLKGQPDWMLQTFCPGFDWKYHRQVMKVFHPKTNNFISGESTQENAGRGGRGTMFFLDEFGFMENGGLIWTNIRASTKHRIAVSTVNIKNGLHMYNLHHGKEGYTAPPVLEIPWYAHPLHDQDWLRMEQERDTPEGFQREVLMNYFAGEGDWVYPITHDMELGNWPFVPYGGPVFVSIDDGYKDRFVIHWIQYQPQSGLHRLVESYTNKGRTIDFYGTLMTGYPRSDFSYTDQELELMEWIRTLPGMTYFGDTHGYNREQITGQAPFDVLRDQFGINVMVDWEKRTLKDRQTYLNKILPFLRINGASLGGDRVLWSLRRHRWKSYKESQEVTRAPKEPVQDDTTHDVSALEYYALNWENFRHMLGGNAISYVGTSNSG